MSAAGVTTVAAGVSLLVSGACLAIFFSTGVETWGRVNDATAALFALLMIPGVWHLASVDDTTWITALSLLCVAGLLVIAATSGLTAAARLDWKLSAKIGAGGFAALLVWMLGTCLRIVADGGLPLGLARLGFLTVLLVGATVAVALVTIQRGGSLMGEDQPPTAISIGAGLAYVSFVVWTLWLGLSL